MHSVFLLFDVYKYSSDPMRLLGNSQKVSPQNVSPLFRHNISYKIFPLQSVSCYKTFPPQK